MFHIVETNTMIKERSLKKLLIFTLIMISLMYIIYHFNALVPFTFRSYQIDQHDSLFTDDERAGWISPSLYNRLRSYAVLREKTIGQIQRRFHITYKKVRSFPLSHDYIQHTENLTNIKYPYSTWTCSNTSNTDYENSGEYCILTNVYYKSATDEYYFYQDPLQNQTTAIPRNSFKTPYDDIRLIIINNLNSLQSPIASILTRPLLVAAPPDGNYAHGFLELLGPRFWVLAECQSHASYVNPKTIQIYYTSAMLKNHLPNWSMYDRQPDGTYQPARDWEQIIQAMFSIYPLLIYTSFNNTTVMFKYMIFPGRQLSRTAAWGYSYPVRPFRSHPLPTEHYRRAYLAYSEWILYHLNLQSKFELTSAQKELQEKKQSERMPICNDLCRATQTKNQSIDNYSGEWIVVLNRRGDKRVINNAKHLVSALLQAFPDQSNPYLRVWPTELFFNDNFHETVHIARSTRLLIGVHGAGLANTVFMRPGTILYEINSYGCQSLSFNFRRWAEVFNLQHALWTPSIGHNGATDNNCHRESSVTLNIGDIINEVKNLLKNEFEYRNGYIKRALDIMNDPSTVDHPPPGYESVLS